MKNQITIARGRQFPWQSQFQLFEDDNNDNNKRAQKQQQLQQQPENNNERASNTITTREQQHERESNNNNNNNKKMAAHRKSTAGRAELQAADTQQIRDTFDRLRNGYSDARNTLRATVRAPNGYLIGR